MFSWSHAYVFVNGALQARYMYQIDNQSDKLPAPFIPPNYVQSVRILTAVEYLDFSLVLQMFLCERSTSDCFRKHCQLLLQCFFLSPAFFISEVFITEQKNYCATVATVATQLRKGIEIVLDFPLKDAKGQTVLRTWRCLHSLTLLRLWSGQVSIS